MEPPTCTVVVRSVRTTGAVATALPPPNDEAGLLCLLLDATAAPAAAAPATRATAAMTTARLVKNLGTRPPARHRHERRRPTAGGTIQDASGRKRAGANEGVHAGLLD